MGGDIEHYLCNAEDRRGFGARRLDEIEIKLKRDCI